MPGTILLRRTRIYHHNVCYLMRQLYRSRRDRLLAQLQPLSPWLTPIATPGGLQLTVRLREGKKEAALFRRSGKSAR